MAAKFAVTGDQFRVIRRRMREIERQLDQDGGSPLDPEHVAEELQRIVEGRFEIEAAEAPSVVNIEGHLLPLSDPDAIRLLLSSRYTADKTEQIVRAWRSLAKALDYNGPIVWQVKAGFTLKHHAPKAGPCYQEFSYLQNWNFPDEPTKDSFVFWIPRLFTNSAGKTVDEQVALLADTRRCYELPDHHLTSFGSAAILAGLILAHFKATGERVPLNNCWTRTDTRDADGRRLFLGAFDGGGLDCDYWPWGGGGNDHLGCFPLGVEI